MASLRLRRRKNKSCADSLLSLGVGWWGEDKTKLLQEQPTENEGTRLRVASREPLFERALKLIPLYSWLLRGLKRSTLLRKNFLLAPKTIVCFRCKGKRRC